MGLKRFLVIFLFLVCNNTWASETLTLKDAISQGLENNKRITSAKERLKSANAGVKEAISYLYPHLNLTSNLNYTEPLGKNKIEQQDNYNTSFGLTLNQTIFDDKNRLSIKSAKKNLVGEELEYEILRQDVIIDVVEAYYQLINAKEREKVYQKGVERAEYLYKITDAKLKEGLVSEIDAKRGLLNLKEEEGKLKSAKTERLIFEENLKVLIGIDASSCLSIDEKVRFNPISVNLDEAIQLALNTNLFLKKEKMNIEKESISKRMIKSQYFPRASFSGNYSYQGIDKTLGKSIDELKQKEYQYSISLNIDIPIYDGGYIKSQLIQKEAGINSLRISIEEKTEKIILDVKEKAARLVSAKDRVIMGEENLILAKESLTIMKAKYELGKASLSEVFEAQDKLEEVHLNYINALTDHEIYRIKFLMLKGGRYEDF